MITAHAHIVDTRPSLPLPPSEGLGMRLHYSMLYMYIVSVVIIKGNIKKKDCKEFYVDKETKNSYENLLDFIINCIVKFIKDRNIRRQLPIGFTFPFPMKHENLTCGKLVRWTRDFKGTGAEGKDVVQLLKEAASRRGVSTRLHVQLITCD